MACPSTDRLVELVEGSMAETERSELEVHIDACSVCRMCVAAIVRTEEPPRALGRFRIDGVLGAGGMGVVYRAFDPALARPIAVKVVRPGIDDAELGARLEREARALGRLSHPNVCHVYDVGRDGDEVWIAMELVDGTTLRAFLGSAPTASALWTVLHGAGRGLAAAHEAGLVHRDVKPENVLVDRTGRAVVTDFGLARALDASTATRPSVLAGTPAYMAPEQLDGIPADARSDQYAFAVMAHEAFAGTRPRHGTASDKLPAPLRAALARALSDDPAARFPSLPSLLDALSAARATPRRRWPLVATIAGSAALAGVGATILLMPPSPPPPPPPSPSPSPSPSPIAVITPPPDASTSTSTSTSTTSKPKRVAIAPPSVDAGIPQQPNPSPRFTQASQPTGAQDLPRIEQYFGSECEIPSSLPKPTLPGPSLMDWGKVTRGPIDVVATLDTGAERDMHLYEVVGARGTYLFDARNGAILAGELAAKPGDLVALCPERADSHWQLPGDLHGAKLTTVRFAAKVSGPPDLAHLPYIHPRAFHYTTKSKQWPYPDRFITYVHDPRLTSDGKYYVNDWYFETDASQAVLPKHFDALMIADRPRFEDRDGRTVVVVHAISFRDHMFPR